MKVYWGSGSIVPRILDLGTRSLSTVFHRVLNPLFAKEMKIGFSKIKLCIIFLYLHSRLELLESINSSFVLRMRYGSCMPIGCSSHSR
jgi:hypothetical protein